MQRRKKILLKNVSTNLYGTFWDFRHYATFFHFFSRAGSFLVYDMFLVRKINFWTPKGHPFVYLLALKIIRTSENNDPMRTYKTVLFETSAGRRFVPLVELSMNFVEPKGEF